MFMESLKRLYYFGLSSFGCRLIRYLYNYAIDDLWIVISLRAWDRFSAQVVEEEGEAKEEEEVAEQVESLTMIDSPRR